MSAHVVAGSTDPRVLEINRRVAALARARRTAADAASRIRELRAAFEAAHSDEARFARDTQATVDAAETALRAIVAEHYQATADKKPTAGVEIKLRSRLEYDPAKALEWAKQTKLALVPESLDVKAFEKIAKATPAAIAFVRHVDEPSVNIATDLDKVLSVAALTTPAVVEERLLDGIEANGAQMAERIEGAEP